jgi:uncharacterized protein (TIGR00251 family)
MNNNIDYFLAKNQFIIPIKVKAGAKTNAITGILKTQDEEWLKISITAPAEQGKANKMLINFLAKEFKVQKSQIKIIQGEGSPFKRITLTLGK